MKWGLFGGTFDPIHFGHLRAAQELIEMLDLERIVFIPAFLPPHKTERVISPFEHRLQMVRLSVSDNERFAFSDVEMQRSGKSYSIDTVRHFLNFHDENLELYFITGQDAFDAITTWHQWDKLLTLCHFVVMTRPGYDNRGLAHILPKDIAADYVYHDLEDCFQGPHGSRVYFRKTTFLDISSSAIRQNIQQGFSVQYLVPDKVIRFMNEKKLYI
ncbi:MAG: nicotinate-nucleotide adenylyltransferase [Smithellaceae bacterium]|nr:nicotinate-nucleotide adenylyltransferase [Smithellaceae bacterium]